jgi:hypothetical protein
MREESKLWLSSREVRQQIATMSSILLILIPGKRC